MLMVYAKCIVVEQNKEAYLKLARELVAETLKETDNTAYELVQGVSGPNLYAFVEHWPDQAALDRHMQTEHFKRLIPQIEQLCEGGVNITVHEILA